MTHPKKVKGKRQKFGTSKKFGRKKGRLLSSPAMRAAKKTSKGKRKEGFSPEEKKRRIAAIQARQKPRAETRPDPKRAGVEDVLAGIDKAGKPKKMSLAREFLTLGTGTALGAIKEVGKTPGAMMAITGGVGGGFGNIAGRAGTSGGFGKGGTWVPANILKAAQKTKTGSLVLNKAGNTAGMVQTNSKTLKIIKSMWNKFLTTKKTVTTTNPITGKTSTEVIESMGLIKPLAIVGVVLGAAAYLQDKMFGGKNFANFLGQEEAGQSAGMSLWIAQAADNYEQFLIAEQLVRDAYAEAPDSQLIPHKNVADGLAKNKRIVLASLDVVAAVMADRQIAKENEESYEVTEARIRANQETGELAMRDDYARRRESARILDAEARIKGDEVSSAFWIEHQKKLIKMEEEDRQATADFWMAYNKAKSQIAEDNRPSNLNFGLL